MNSTLLLNASYEPLKIIPWERAITLFFLGKVEVVEEYESEVRSVSLVVKRPCVVRLLRYVNLGRRRPPLSKVNLLARDNFECQYCSRELSYSEATVDHVIPRSQGGATRWDNVVVACSNCNRRKGGRTPNEAAMHLRIPPRAPEWLPVLHVRYYRRVPPAWELFLAPGKV